MPVLEKDIPRYLQNTEEVLDPEITEFTGKLPGWVEGVLYSSSPGLFDLEKASVNNWFDGYAIISKFEINKGGKVTFSSKYLQSNAYKKALEGKRPISCEFGTPPWTSNKKFFSKLMPFGPYDCTDNVIGTIFRLGGSSSSSLYTAGDTCYIHELDPQTLESLRCYHTTKAFGMNSISSKPMEDSSTGDVYLIGAAVQPTFRYTILKMKGSDKDLALEKRFSPLCSFPSRWMFGACPCRNFGMSENYIVMIEMPLVLSIMKLASTYIKGYKALDWLDWRPEDGVRFYIIHKETGDVIKTEIMAKEPFFTTSIINTYDDGNEITLDLISMPNVECNQWTSLNSLRTRVDSPSKNPILESGRIYRYIIPVIRDIKLHPEGQSLLKSPYASYNSVNATRVGDKLIVTPENLLRTRDADGIGLDFDVINPNYRGKKYTFSYNHCGYISNPFSPYAYGYVKLNVETKDVQIWKGKEGQALHEPVFVPNPKGTSEDDGVLIGLVKIERSYDENNFLVAVDAKTMTEVGRAYLNSPVASWFHSSFFNTRKS